MNWQGNLFTKETLANEVGPSATWWNVIIKTQGGRPLLKDLSQSMVERALEAVQVERPFDVVRWERSDHHLHMIWRLPRDDRELRYRVGRLKTIMLALLDRQEKQRSSSRRRSALHRPKKFWDPVSTIQQIDEAIVPVAWRRLTNDVQKGEDQVGKVLADWADGKAASTPAPGYLF